jgi:hypothetical protein
MVNLISIAVPIGMGSTALGIFLWHVTRRRWLEVTLTGIVLTRRAQKISVADEQIIAVSRLSVTNPNGGIERIVWMEIDREGTVERVECHYGIPRGQMDPLEALLNRVFRSLARRTHDGLSRGAALSGKGWRVDRDGLHCKLGGKRAIYPLNCLSHVGRHGGRLCLWKGSEERPFLSIPLGSRNAYPLEVFLREASPANPVDMEQLPGRPLGRLLLRYHQPDRGRGLAVAAGALVVALFLITMGLSTTIVFGQLVCLLLGAITLCISPLGIFAFVRSDRPTIHFHESGVSQPTRKAMGELLYTDVEAMTWKGAKEILFTSRAGSDRPVIHYRSAYGKETVELIGYRDHAAGIIARRWLAELEKGPVTWTPRLRFLPDGLEYRPDGVIGKGEPRIVPYDKIYHRIEHGKWLLFVRGDFVPMMRERIDGVNFFPGLMLLRMIQERSRPCTPGPDVKTLAPRLEAKQATTPEPSDLRITSQGPASAAVTDKAPDVGGLVEEEE